jgi:hypothetical protein
MPAAASDRRPPLAFLSAALCAATMLLRKRQGEESRPPDLRAIGLNAHSPDARSPDARSLAAIGLLSLSLLVTGCSPPPPPPPPTAETPAIGNRLLQELDQELDLTLQYRRLNTVDHGAWQILHGVLAYQQSFPIEVGRGGPLKPALQYGFDGGDIHGWTFQPGDTLDAATGRVGLRAIVEPGTRKGQGHPDQWLAIMSQCNIPATQTLQVGGRSFTVQDLIDQILRDVPFNANREWSWTLSGLTKYLPTSAEWTASDGQRWSIEKLVQLEVEQEINSSACGGTHRLMGMAVALKRHRAAGGAVTGVWQDADQLIQEHIRRALDFQNPDGSFSSNYLRRPGTSADVAQLLASSGHVLEFLTVSMSDEQLRQPSVARAVQHTCRLLQQTRGIALECGALYHAVHGLVLYRERIFGPRPYTIPVSNAGPPA